MLRIPDFQRMKSEVGKWNGVPQKSTWLVARLPKEQHPILQQFIAGLAYITRKQFSQPVLFARSTAVKKFQIKFQISVVKDLGPHSSHDHQTRKGNARWEWGDLLMYLRISYTNTLVVHQMESRNGPRIKHWWWSLFHCTRNKAAK